MQWAVNVWLLRAADGICMSMRANARIASWACDGGQVQMGEALQVHARPFIGGDV